MRPSPRPIHAEDNRRPAPGATPAPEPSGPLTPHRPSTRLVLDRLIRSLEAEWQLGLRLRDHTWSPSQSSSSLADKVYGQIKRLYFSSAPRLDRALKDFKRYASGFDQETRLRFLHNMLKSQTQDLTSKTDTPLSTRSHGRQDALQLEDVPPTCLRNSQLSNQVLPSMTPFHHYREDEPSSYYTAPDPGSPTDEEEDDDYAMPPSPTLSSVSAMRRADSGSHFSLGSTNRKRPSDSSSISGSSPKSTKTGKAKQFCEDLPSSGHSRPPPIPLFKKPSLEMARSFQATSGRSSFDTSFNSTSSSQQTQPDTANTSFTSDGYEAHLHYPKLARTSSTVLDSFSKIDLLNATSKLEESAKLGTELTKTSQGSIEETPSTFGSIDEDGLIEAEKMLSPAPEMETSGLPRRHVLQSNSATVGATSTNSGFQHHNVASIASPAISSPYSNGSNGTASPNKAALQAGVPLPVASLFRSLPQSPQAPAKVDSPSKLPWYIREIPQQNLFVEELPAKLLDFPYFILFICCRISAEYGIQIQDLMQGLDATQVRTDSNTFWDMIENHPEVSHVSLRDSTKVWSAARRDFDGFAFKGRLVFNNREKEPAFKLELMPIQPEKSCRLQRKFGSDRFLCLTVPSFTSNRMRPPRFKVDQMKQIQTQWNAWFSEEHSFLGRKWKAFRIDPTKKKGVTKKDRTFENRVILFATEGCGIKEQMTIGELINWHIPLDKNKEQNFCKANARLDLGLSKTIPTFTFKPSQVQYVSSNVMADGTPEDTRHDDSTLSWKERCVTPPVMNDGCATISVGALLEIWNRYRKATETNDPIPSVIQGRIGGAKGVWMISGEPHSKNPRDLDIWIEITPSQLKFEPHDEDRADEQPWDAHRLTFDHVNHSSSSGSTDLHIDFIPIMIDRGVSRASIASLISTQLDKEKEQLLQALIDPVKVYNWVHKEGSSCQNAENVRWQASLPQSLPQKIKLLLQSGFSPVQAPYLANQLYRFVKQRQIWMEQNLRVPIGKATCLFGVADPLGVLKPGEVHVEFSSPFVDELSGETFRSLDGLDILVSRQPACRRSDIQRVHAIKHTALSHLVDVVVFPRKGEYPLAAKLQGGDYDGDKFWICWEADLVKPFKNAPAPLNTPDPTWYGIKKDQRKLHQVMDTLNLSTVDNLLKEVLEFRTAPSLLGAVTNFLKKQAYKENQIYSERLDALCDVHDLLVDAPKHAYLFTEKDFQVLVRSKLGCGNPRLPAYLEAMDACENAKERGEADKIRERDFRHKSENALDFLYFEVVRKHNVETLKAVKFAFPKEDDGDSTLRLPYLQLKNTAPAIVREQFQALATSLKDIYWEWNRGIIKNPGFDSDNYNQVVENCYKSFRALMPPALDHPDIKPWLYPYLDPKFNIWETLRASFLYTEYPKKHAFVWNMAGRELARLKCRAMPCSWDITGNILANMKPKPIKAPKLDADDDSEDDLEGIMESIPA